MQQVVSGHEGLILSWRLRQTPGQYSLARGSTTTARPPNRDRPAASNGGTSQDREPVFDANGSDDSEPASVSRTGRVANLSGCVNSKR
jgi:hypothetical protein